MSTSTSRSGPPKKISCWVRPGVFEVRASARRPVSALIRLDLPTLERPANAISGAPIGGTDSIDPAAEMKSHAPANNSRPASISAAEKSAMVSALRSPVSLRHGWWPTSAMAHAMNDDLVLGRLIKNQVRIGRGNHAPQTALAGKLTGMGMPQQEIDNDPNTCLHPAGAPRRPRLDIRQHLIEFG